MLVLLSLLYFAGFVGFVYLIFLLVVWTQWSPLFGALVSLEPLVVVAPGGCRSWRSLGSLLVQMHPTMHVRIYMPCVPLQTITWQWKLLEPSQKISGPGCIGILEDHEAKATMILHVALGACLRSKVPSQKKEPSKTGQFEDILPNVPMINLIWLIWLFVHYQCCFILRHLIQLGKKDSFEHPAHIPLSERWRCSQALLTGPKLEKKTSAGPWSWQGSLQVALQEPWAQWARNGCVCNMVHPPTNGFVYRIPYVQCVGTHVS